ncbi:thioredoxin-like protein [Mycena maculata]|uniref:Thioredoxin-like protein n=1 Tax=Mycena maculata TaxID=230809 RepID=A0AAD7JDZ1_9AGAR|nr:thioredoxin-like protein [Mycena maculata]
MLSATRLLTTRIPGHIYTAARRAPSYTHSFPLPFILSNLFSSAPNHSASSSKATMSVQEFVEEAIANNKIAIFSRSWCPYCARAKALFADKFPEETPLVLELDERDDGDAIQDYLANKTGQTSVPNVFVNKKQIGGNDKTQDAFRSGELQRLVSQ